MFAIPSATALGLPVPAFSRLLSPLALFPSMLLDLPRCNVPSHELCALEKRPRVLLLLKNPDADNIFHSALPALPATLALTPELSLRLPWGV